MARRERLEREPRVAAVGAPEVRLGEKPAQVRVARRRLDEQRQVGAVAEGYLGASDRLETEWLRSLRERHRAVEAVVIGKCERGVAELVSGHDEILGERGAVEKRKRGVAVQLGVHQQPCVVRGVW